MPLMMRSALEVALLPAIAVFPTGRRSIHRFAARRWWSIYRFAALFAWRRALVGEVAAHRRKLHGRSRRRWSRGFGDRHLRRDGGLGNIRRLFVAGRRLFDDRGGGSRFRASSRASAPFRRFRLDV